MAVYVGIGHGMEPDGVFDPGAVSADGTREHDLNKEVVAAVGAALSRSGIAHFVETDSGASHDPDYRGSTDAVNAGGYGLAIEVHFDSGMASVGGFGIYLNDQSPGKRFADAIRARWGQHGLPHRDNQADVRHLLFIHGTNCPAIIWECDRTAVHDPATLVQMGEAIGAGICDFLGAPVVRSMRRRAAQVTPKFDPPLQLHDVVGDCAAPATGGAFVLTADGAVYAFGGAQYHGAPNADPNAHWPEGHRRGARIEPHGDGYVITDTAGERYSYGP